MSALDDKIQAVSDAVQDLGQDMQAGFDKLKATIDAGGDTTAQETALQAIIDKIKGFDATAEGVSGVQTPPQA